MASKPRGANTNTGLAGRIEGREPFTACVSLSPEMPMGSNYPSASGLLVQSGNFSSRAATAT